MKFVISNQVVVFFPPEGQLADHIISFSNSLRDEGYADFTIYRKVLLAACFSSWLKQQKVNPRNITSNHVTQYLQYRFQHLKPRADDATALKHFVKFLRLKGTIPEEKIITPRLTQAEKFVKAYEQYLLETRGLASATVAKHRPFIHGFLKGRFGKGRLNLSRLKANDVVRFVQQQAPHLHPKGSKTMTYALRSFLQYARLRGEITIDLASAVPVVANWSMADIPRAIEANQVSQLLNSIDQSTAMGLRDYAILLLLARLGLRSGEIVSLELDDIDWNRGLLCVLDKYGQHKEFPLTAEVGKAIAAYLQQGRPQSTSRRVFLRVRAPNCGFKSSSGVGSVVRHSLQRAGVKAPTCGTHQFRHGLATRMLRKGSSLTEIGAVLGHRHPETTKIYTKVDIKALRPLALPWPGGKK